MEGQGCVWRDRVVCMEGGDGEVGRRHGRVVLYNNPGLMVARGEISWTLRL